MARLVDNLLGECTKVGRSGTTRSAAKLSRGVLACCLAGRKCKEKLSPGRKMSLE